MWDLAVMNLGLREKPVSFAAIVEPEKPKYVMSEKQRLNVERNHERARIKGAAIKKRVVEHIRKQKTINSMEAAKKLGIGGATVVNKMRELEREGKVRMIGAGNRVRWEWIG